ncbi:alpha/beta hydrolase [Actinokineospora enzanensis]|uniref:alpha/beta hydrolase n=1 Tax=Actinokineospora enzanensis TaxID=155975 RepID=UPI0003829E2A|nr:alpha/beta hydrolase [Actinokineospora enzanensis]
MWKRTVAALAVATFAAGALPGVAAAQAQARGLDWRPCPADGGQQCAQVQVPLNHRDPRGREITLAVARIPASDQRHRIGSLFINPGGPGLSATENLGSFATALGERIRARYDIVAMDPRGIGGSTPLDCDPKPGQPAAAPRPEQPFPISAEETRVWQEFNQSLRDRCARNGGDLLRYMSTADVAQDMDLVRQAVGDARLNYYGASYGSVLGATYAAMFPNRVRAMIVDGVADPVAWTTGGRERQYLYSARVGSAESTREAITSALAECDRVGPARCAAAGSARQKYDAVLARLRQGPIEVEGRQLTYQLAVSLLQQLSTTAAKYPEMMASIEQLYQAISAGDVDVAPNTPAPGAPEPDTFGATPANAAIACADSVNPGDRDAVTRSVDWASRTGREFGPLWSWDGSACVRWPVTAPNAFRGLWWTWTASPMLIVGNTHDPNTPISGAKALHRLMPNSRLLTVDTYGHTALDQKCAVSAYEGYLLDRKLPRATCAANGPLFP